MKNLFYTLGLALGLILPLSGSLAKASIPVDEILNIGKFGYKIGKAVAPVVKPVVTFVVGHTVDKLTDLNEKRKERKREREENDPKNFYHNPFRAAHEANTNSYSETSDDDVHIRVHIKRQKRDSGDWGL